MNIFKRIVYAFIQTINEDKYASLECEFSEEVKRRQIENKKTFIDVTTNFIKKKCYEQTGH
jgi:hypothetical protein